MSKNIHKEYKRYKKDHSIAKASGIFFKPLLNKSGLKNIVVNKDTIIQYVIEVSNIVMSETGL